MHEVRPRDCVIQTADHFEHTFVAGPDGLEYLVYGTRHPTEIAWLPRSRAIRTGWPWVEGRDDDPWDIEAAGPPLEVGDPKPRPENIRNVDEVELESERNQTWAGFDGSEPAGFAWEQLAPGKMGSVPHCHSEEEEIFVILEGSATLAPLAVAAQASSAARSASSTSCGPATSSRGRRAPASSHHFIAGDDGCTMLVYGTRKPNDMAFYPRSNKISGAGSASSAASSTSTTGTASRANRYVRAMELQEFEGAATIEKVAALCRRRAFVFPSSDIYGGLGSSFDFGHYGVLLNDNVKNEWRRSLIQEREDVVALDSAIILNPQVWVASGHVDTFSDPLVDCRTCKLRFRADKLEDAHCGRRPSKQPGRVLRVRPDRAARSST